MLTDGTTRIEPTLWLDGSGQFKSQNRVHQLISGRVAVTLGAASPRTGSLAFLFEDEETAKACVDMHRTGQVFNVEEPTRPTIALTYVIAEGGSVSFELDQEHDLWIVKVDYQEVNA